MTNQQVHSATINLSSTNDTEVDSKSAENNLESTNMHYHKTTDQSEGLNREKTLPTSSASPIAGSDNSQNARKSYIDQIAEGSAKQNEASLQKTTSVVCAEKVAIHSSSKAQPDTDCNTADIQAENTAIKAETQPMSSNTTNTKEATPALAECAAEKGARCNTKHGGGTVNGDQRGQDGGTCCIKAWLNAPHKSSED